MLMDPPAGPPPNVGPADSTSLPLCAMGPPETGEQPMLYWPFSISDLSNWRTQNAKFSDDPKDLIGLLNTVLFTQPTWEDCQQLLQVLFTTEERERTQAEAQKSVLGEDRQPTQNPDLINAAFPLSCPTWDYNSAEDDILLVTEDRDTCLRGTKDLLQTIAALGYQASAKKAQICRAEVSYLGYKLKDGQRWLTDAWK
ncbi:uncharacterized protein LOC111094054 isoform X2 [Canis lupus familiaris]|uniref:uncharacterized protein LOC111094054 isoform X2 n=1 Tax=Canis lupus familiaris TaxID=9615 RepID=UPI0018F521BC|nr:uncharacterized protein LOC111094054 isoform X2 [Canis lupus familiaris]